MLFDRARVLSSGLQPSFRYPSPSELCIKLLRGEHYLIMDIWTILGQTTLKLFECKHSGPLLLEDLSPEDGYRARCLLCETVGPARETSGEAQQALQERLQE